MTSLFLPKTAADSKYPESILTIDRSALRNLPLKEGFVPYSDLYLSEFIKHVWISHSFRVREDADEKKNWGENYKGNRDVIQWLNYINIEQDDGLLIPYMRSREGGGESDLKGRGSIGAGGHTDFVDAVHERSIIDLERTAILNIARELWEECQFVTHTGNKITLETLQIVDAIEPNRIAEEITTFEQAVQFLESLGTLAFQGWLFDNSDNVGRLHLGVCWRIKLHKGITAVSREKGVDFIEPICAQDLLTTYPNVTFENWSKLFLEYLCDDSIPKNSYSIFE